MTTYVLVEQDKVMAMVLRRSEIYWETEILDGASSIPRLPEIDVDIPLERIYERTAAVKV
jgi:hypothetical protein